MIFGFAEIGFVGLYDFALASKWLKTAVRIASRKRCIMNHVICS